MWDFMCAFNSEVSISSNHLGLIRIKLIVLQSQMLHNTWPPCWIAQHQAQHSHSCGRTYEINYSPVSQLPTQGYETLLYRESTPPTFLIVVPSFIYLVICLCHTACRILVPLSRDQTHTPCIGNMESQPLGYQGNPCGSFMSLVVEYFFFWSFSLMLVLQIVVIWRAHEKRWASGSFYSSILAYLCQG